METLPERLVGPSHQKNQLKNLLQGYVDSFGRTAPDTSTVRECLQAMSQQKRYKLIATVKIWLGDTAIHCAAGYDRTELVNCLLDSVTQQQCYELVKIQTRGGYTAIHCAAWRDHPHIIQCILDRLTTDQQLHLLNIQCRRDNSTALEVAQACNSDSAVAVLQQYISAAETVIQQRQLTDNADEDRRELTTRFERLEERIVELQTQLKSAEEKCRTDKRQHGKERQAQDRNIAELKQKIAAQGKEIGELKVEAAAKGKQVDQLKQADEARKKELRSQEEIIAAQGKQVAQLTEALDAERNQRLLLEQQLTQSVEFVVDQVGDNSNRLTNELSQMRREGRQNSEELRLCKEELRQCKEEMRETTQQLRLCKEKLNMCVEEGTQSKQELTEKIHKLTEELNQQQTHICQLKAKLEEHEKDIRWMDDEVTARGSTEAVDNSDAEVDYEEGDNPLIADVNPAEDDGELPVQVVNPH